MAKRMKTLEMVKLSPQDTCKPTRKFMEQAWKFWHAFQRHTWRITITSDLGKEGRDPVALYHTVPAPNHTRKGKGKDGEKQERQKERQGELGMLWNEPSLILQPETSALVSLIL